MRLLVSYPVRTSFSYGTYGVNAIIGASVVRQNYQGGIQMKAKNSLLITEIAVVSLCLSSCMVTSKEPLSNPDEAKLDEQLLGIWYEEGKSPQEIAYTAFLPLEENRLRVIYISPLGVMQFYGFISKIGDESYLNLRSLQQGYFLSPNDPASYILVHYRINKSKELEISLFSWSFFKEAIKAGLIKGKAEEEEIELTDSTENLAKFVKQNIDQKYLEKKLHVLKKLRR